MRGRCRYGAAVKLKVGGGETKFNASEPITHVGYLNW